MCSLKILYQIGKFAHHFKENELAQFWIFVSRQALERLNLQVRDFGRNVEMQAKVARFKLRMTAVSVKYHRRRDGKSKISGTVLGSDRAGVKVLLTVRRCGRAVQYGYGSPLRSC